MGGNHPIAGDSRLLKHQNIICIIMLLSIIDKLIFPRAKAKCSSGFYGMDAVS
jgi:hypothetical protein